MEAGPPNRRSLGGLIRALAREPGYEDAWTLGGHGGSRTAAVLERRCGSDVLFLHARATPAGSAEIDHLAIARSGVWVIAAKRFPGRLRIGRARGAEADRLLIGGRDRSGLVPCLRRQVLLVGATIDEVDPNVKVRGALCLLEAALPILRRPAFGGIPVLDPPALGRQLDAPGPISPERGELLRGELAERFPPA